MSPSGGFEYALVVVVLFSGWPEAFPERNQSARTTAKKLLSEIVCRYRVPEVIESDQEPTYCSLTMQYDTLSAYVIELTKKLADIHSRVFSSLPDPDSVSGTHSLKPGDWVLVKKFVRRTPLGPRFDGHFQVLLMTPTSVKLEGRPTCIHSSHCKKDLLPEDDTQARMMLWMPCLMG
ncbi:unnamed protein product, partial [Ranitomeya imitator]